MIRLWLIAIPRNPISSCLRGIEVRIIVIARKFHIGCEPLTTDGRLRYKPAGEVRFGRPQHLD